jgi:hypothetical protein
VTGDSTLQVAGVNVPVVRVEYGAVSDLPDPAEGTYLIVSLLVAMARPDRHDLLVPVELVRDATGAIAGCRALARFDHHQPGSTDAHPALA